MTTAFLGLGSNVNAKRNIRSAMTTLSRDFGELAISPVYSSRSVGFDGDDFINLVIALETELDADELRHYLRALEDRHDRQRNVPKFSDRTLDIDILLLDDLVLDTETLQIPRPEIVRFAHVLRPLADLVPDRVYPGSDQTIGQLWAAWRGDDPGLELMDPGFLSG